MLPTSFRRRRRIPRCQLAIGFLLAFVLLNLWLFSPPQRKPHSSSRKQLDTFHDAKFGSSGNADKQQQQHEPERQQQRRQRPRRQRQHRRCSSRSSASSSLGFKGIHGLFGGVEDAKYVEKITSSRWFSLSVFMSCVSFAAAALLLPICYRWNNPPQEPPPPQQSLLPLLATDLLLMLSAMGTMEQWLAFGGAMAALAALVSAVTALLLGLAAHVLGSKIQGNSRKVAWRCIYMTTLTLSTLVFNLLFRTRQIRLWTLAVVFTLSTIVPVALRGILRLQYPVDRILLHYSIVSGVNAGAWGIYSWKVEYHHLHIAASILGVCINAYYWGFLTWHKCNGANEQGDNEENNGHENMNNAEEQHENINNEEQEHVNEEQHGGEDANEEQDEGNGEHSQDNDEEQHEGDEEQHENINNEEQEDVNEEQHGGDEEQDEGNGEHSQDNDEEQHEGDEEQHENINNEEQEDVNEEQHGGEDVNEEQDEGNGEHSQDNDEEQHEGDEEVVNSDGQDE